MTFHIKYPFLYLLIALIAGILCNDSLSLPLYCLPLLPAIGICLFLIKDYRNCADGFLLFTIFCCGQHLTPVSDFSPNEKQTYHFKSRCEEELSGHNYILSAENQKFYLSSFDADTIYRPGDSLYFECRIIPLTDLSNPGEFSYTNYLKRQDIHFRLLPITKIEKYGRAQNINFFFGNLRQKLLDKTARLTPDTTCRHVISALCLGFKNDLDSELQDLFITTGTVHLLSVSGLHTGAIYLLLIYILGCIGLSKRTKELIVIPFLWSYACLTGLSPSAVRAATILTFITLGKIFYKSYTPLNAIAASAFFTLLIVPSNLYSLSFLMSYSAYTGILLLYPVFLHLPGQLPKYSSKLYACCCITVAAQIPTLPINAFFFHTININSFLCNIIAVPIATLILYGATVCLLLPVSIGLYIMPGIEFLNNILINSLQFLRPIMLNIQKLYPTIITIVIAYLLLLFVYLYIKQRKTYWLKSTGITLLCLIVYASFENHNLASRREILVSHQYGGTSILLNYHGFYSILHSTDTTLRKTEGYLYQNRLQPQSLHSGVLNSFIEWHNHQLYTPTDTIIIAPSDCHTYPRKYSLIVTRNSTPEKVFTSPGSSFPSFIIIDGSNSIFTVRKWQIFCRDNKIIFHNTNKKGPIILTLK